jgi:signal peptidase II
MLCGGHVVLRLLLVAGLVVILDQSTKMLVASRLAEGESAALAPGLKIRRLTNRQSVLRHHPRGLALVLAGLLGAICLIVQQGYFFQPPAAQLGLGLALGGACSNLSDQLRRGGVMDFLDLGWWPVFNLADVAITIGVILAFWFFQ